MHDELVAEVRKLRATFELAFRDKLEERIRSLVTSPKQVAIWNLLDGERDTKALATSTKVTVRYVNLLLGELEAAGMVNRNKNGIATQIARITLVKKEEQENKDE